MCQKLHTAESNTSGTNKIGQGLHVPSRSLGPDASCISIMAPKASPMASPISICMAWAKNKDLHMSDGQNFIKFLYMWRLHIQTGEFSLVILFSMSAGILFFASVNLNHCYSLLPFKYQVAGLWCRNDESYDSQGWLTRQRRQTLDMIGPLKAWLMDGSILANELPSLSFCLQWQLPCLDVNLAKSCKPWRALSMSQAKPSRRRLRTFCKHWDLRTKDFGNLAPWQPKVRFVALRWVEYEKRAAWAWMFRQEHLVWRKIMLTSSLEPQNVLNDVSPDFEATMNSQQPTHHVLEIALQASCSTPSFQQCQVSCSIRQPANGNQENRLTKKTS